MIRPGRCESLLPSLLSIAPTQRKIFWDISCIGPPPLQRAIIFVVVLQPFLFLFCCLPLRSHRHQTNGDEQKFGNLLATFTKGLRHNLESGVIESLEDFETFRQTLCTGDPAEIEQIPLGPGNAVPRWQSTLANAGPGSPFDTEVKARAWESSGAGLTYDLQGLDAQAETMPPAPQLGSPELEYEMAELYLMALARDIPFSVWNTNEFMYFAADVLNSLPWVSSGAGLDDMSQAEKFRRDGKLHLSPQTIFRGYGAGVGDGPYISQYLLRGSQGLGTDQTRTGQVAYGALGLDMRVRSIRAKKDWMTT